MTGWLHEPLYVVVLDAQKLHFLEASGGLLGQAKPLCIRLKHFGTILGQQGAQLQIDQSIAATNDCCCCQSNKRLDHNQKNKKSRCENCVRDHFQAGYQHGTDEASNFCQNRFANVRAVALKKPRVRLMQVNFEKTAGQGEAAHRGIPHNRICSERLNTQPGKHDQKNHAGQEKSEIRFRREVQSVVCPRHDRIGFNDARVSQHSEKNKDSGNAENFSHAYKQHDYDQDKEPLLFPIIKQRKYFLENVKHFYTRNMSLGEDVQPGGRPHVEFVTIA